MAVNEEILVFALVDTIIYGFSVLMFVATLWSLINIRSESGVNKVMLSATLLLFVLNTLYIAADIAYVHRGFLVFGGADSFFAAAREETFKNSIYELETLLADAILIYRCYMVWQSRWIILVPCILWASVAVCATSTVWFISKPVTDGDNVFLIQVGRWVISFYSTAFVTNFVSTALLAYKIWTVNREYNQSCDTERNKGRSLRPLLIFVIECGALYSCALLMMLATYVSKSTAAYVAIDLTSQIIPITFYALIIRASVSRRNSTGRRYPSLVSTFIGAQIDAGNTFPTTLDIRLQPNQCTDTNIEMTYVRKEESQYK